MHCQEPHRVPFPLRPHLRDEYGTVIGLEFQAALDSTDFR